MAIIGMQYPKIDHYKSMLVANCVLVIKGALSMLDIIFVNFLVIMII